MKKLTEIFNVKESMAFKATYGDETKAAKVLLDVLMDRIGAEYDSVQKAKLVKELVSYISDGYYYDSAGIEWFDPNKAADAFEAESLDLDRLL